MKHFLTVQDYSKKELLDLIELAFKMKSSKALYYDALKNKKLGLIFEKSSTRTRVSFEAGMQELGGYVLFLSSRDLQLGRGEPIKDTARVLSRYLDALMIRTFAHQNALELAKYGSIPVINGLTDLLHPCQAMADIMTIIEKKGKIEGINISYVGDGNNVAHSLGLIASKLGANFSIATPGNYEMDPALTDLILSNAQNSGAKIDISNHPMEAVEGADVIYADVWTSMGQEAESQVRLKAFKGFQINEDLVKYAKEDYIFMHCLPAHRGEEVTEEIFESENSVVFDQAENRMHAQKAILFELLKD